MNIWNDGRSGESGRYAGNLVLKRFDSDGTRISNHKGTVFVDARHCWIGRVVGDDAYLTTGVLHWANVSADQHRELLQFAKESRRALLYLFITAHPGSQLIRFWQVPAAVLERELKRRGKDARGSVLGLHISDRAGRHMLGDEDVTEHHTEFKIDFATAAELTSVVRSDRKKKGRSTDTENGTDGVDAASVDAAANTKMRRFDIPLSGGRIATLTASGAMTAQDVDRLKGYIDLMSDLLVN